MLRLWGRDISNAGTNGAIYATLVTQKKTRQER
jgi:hypothetical protein